MTFDVYDSEAYDGSANLYFSARDLHRWVTSRYSDPVLSEAALARGMEVPVFANGDGRRSIGWPVTGYRVGGLTSSRGIGAVFHHEIYWYADRRLSAVWVTHVLEAKPLPPLLTRALIDILEGKSLAPVGDPDFQAPAPGEDLYER